jgi:CubicO group peptidase (beta-lactamase class C family)
MTLESMSEKTGCARETSECIRGEPLLPGTRPSSDRVLGYGYQWWIPENPQGDFLAIGIHDQFIYVSPRNHLVIAKTSTYADYDRDGEKKELESIAFFRAIAESMK